MGFSRSLLQCSGKLKNLSASLRRNPPRAAAEPVRYVERNYLGHGRTPSAVVRFLQHPFVYAQKDDFISKSDLGQDRKFDAAKGNARSWSLRVHEFYQKRCQEKSSASTGVEI